MLPLRTGAAFTWEQPIEAIPQTTVDSGTMHQKHSNSSLNNGTLPSGVPEKGRRRLSEGLVLSISTKISEHPVNKCSNDKNAEGHSK